MLKVRILHLSPDLTSAQPDLGVRDLGDLDAESLARLLDRFRGLDAAQNHDASPAVAVTGAGGTFWIRTLAGRLLVREESEPDSATRDLTIDAILQAAVGPGTTSTIGTARGPGSVRIAAAILILLGSIAIDARTVRSLRRISSVERPVPGLQAVTDAHELTALRSAASGRYRTGNEPGDRIIELDATGRVRFSRQLSTGERATGEDACDVGRAGKALWLTTRGSGAIQVQNIDTLSYYQDVYRRERN